MQNYSSSALVNAYSLLIFYLILLSILGLSIAIRNKDNWMWKYVNQYFKFHIPILLFFFTLQEQIIIIALQYKNFRTDSVINGFSAFIAILLTFNITVMITGNIYQICKKEENGRSQVTKYRFISFFYKYASPKDRF